MTVVFVESFTERERYQECNATYDRAFAVAITSRSRAVEDVIGSFAELAQQATNDPKASRSIFARYLVARDAAAERYPLPEVPNC